MEERNEYGTGCLCRFRAETDGCTEWSCPWHGDNNMRESLRVREACPVHMTATPVDQRTGGTA